jgi:hypothetical protein
VVLDNAQDISVRGLIATDSMEYGVSLKGEWDTLRLSEALFKNNALGEMEIVHSTAGLTLGDSAQKAQLKALVASATDFTDFKAKVAAW